MMMMRVHYDLVGFLGRNPRLAYEPVCFAHSGVSGASASVSSQTKIRCPTEWRGDRGGRSSQGFVRRRGRGVPGCSMGCSLVRRSSVSSIDERRSSSILCGGFVISTSRGWFDVRLVLH